jgi:predicted transcriptional regulator
MEALWSGGESTVREVMEALNRTATKPRAYTTYMTVMARLDGKGLLQRRRAGRTDHYSPAFSREAYRAARARSEVQELVEQYGDLALSNFAARIAGLDPARRRALERLAEQDYDAT